MDSLKHVAGKFTKDEQGAAMAEYAILIAFIAVVSITIITTFGGKISTKFSEVSAQFK